MTDTNPVEVEVEIVPEGVRRSRRFWAIDPQLHTWQEVTAYECIGSPRTWWVPELGFSMTVGHHLFESEVSCLQVLADQLREERNHIKRQLSDVEYRLRELDQSETIDR